MVSLREAHKLMGTHKGNELCQSTSFIFEIIRILINFILVVYTN